MPVLSRLSTLLFLLSPGKGYRNLTTSSSLSRSPWFRFPPDNLPSLTDLSDKKALYSLTRVFLPPYSLWRFEFPLSYLFPVHFQTQLSALFTILYEIITIQQLHQLMFSHGQRSKCTNLQNSYTKFSVRNFQYLCLYTFIFYLFLSFTMSAFGKQGTWAQIFHQHPRYTVFPGKTNIFLHYSPILGQNQTDFSHLDPILDCFT